MQSIPNYLTHWRYYSLLLNYQISCVWRHTNYVGALRTYPIDYHDCRWPCLKAARLVVWIIASLWISTGACQISEWSDYSKCKSRGFETSRDLTISCLIVYWNGALLSSLLFVGWSCDRGSLLWFCILFFEKTDSLWINHTTERSPQWSYLYW